MGFSEIISSVLSGGLTGVIGSAISRYADYKSKQLDMDLQKLKMANEVELKQVDAHIMEMEWQSREKISIVESDAKMDVADSKAFQTSLTSEPKMFSNPSKYNDKQNAMMVFVDCVRGLIRPGLTLYLSLITTLVYWEAGGIIKKNILTPEQAVQIYTQISSTILYLTSCCVLFWFGSRPTSKNGKGN